MAMQCSGAVVEDHRAYEDRPKGRKRLGLAIPAPDLNRSRAQTNAPGATLGLTGNCLARGPANCERRVRRRHSCRYGGARGHLVEEGLAPATGTARDIRARSACHTARARAGGGNCQNSWADRGLAHHPLAERPKAPWPGIYRERLTLSSGRFAMIDRRARVPIGAVAGRRWSNTGPGGSRHRHRERHRNGASGGSAGLGL